jgi:hypothetical protein
MLKIMHAQDMINVEYAQKAKYSMENETPASASALETIKNAVEARSAAIDQLLAELRADEPRRDRAIHEALLRAI